MSLLMPHATDPVEAPSAARIDHALRAVRESHVPLGAKLILEGQTLQLPPAVYDAVLDLLQRFSEGHGVVVGSVDSLLTTSQAADLLGISRTYMVRLLDDGRIPVEFRGSHRRVQLTEVMAYLEESRRARTSKLDDIAALSARTGQYVGDDF